jgi:hypothetical protein
LFRNIFDGKIGRGRYVSLLRDLLLYNRAAAELWGFESNKWAKTVEASPGNVSPVIDLINNELDVSHSSVLLAVALSDHSIVLCCIDCIVLYRLAGK